MDEAELKLMIDRMQLEENAGFVIYVLPGGHIGIELRSDEHGTVGGIDFSADQAIDFADRLKDAVEHSKRQRSATEYRHDPIEQL